MYTIITLLGKLSALIAMIAIPLTAIDMVATDKGIVIAIIGFLICCICETAVNPNQKFIKRLK